MIDNAHTLHGTAIYAYIDSDPPNYPIVGIYGSPMECLGCVRVSHGFNMFQPPMVTIVAFAGHPGFPTSRHHQGLHHLEGASGKGVLGSAAGGKGPPQPFNILPRNTGKRVQIRACRHRFVWYRSWPVSGNHV